MKKYMVVYAMEGEQSAAFLDTYTDAHNFKMDVECGMGGYAEIYKRIEVEDGIEEYVFVEA